MARAGHVRLLGTGRRHVTLGFYHGGALPDPAGLLPVKGGNQVSGTLSMRSLRIAGTDDLAKPALRDLIEAAARHQVEFDDGLGTGFGLAC